MSRLNKPSGKLDEALQYFKGRKGYHSLFLLFRRKYESLGRFGGTIDLAQCSEQGLEELALFMGTSPHHLSRKGVFMLTDFEQRLQHTRFAGVSLLALLEHYFGEALITKRMRKQQRTDAQGEKLVLLKRRYPQLADWFLYLEGRTSDTHWIWRRLLEPDFETDVHDIAEAFAALPDGLERYPLFSQRVTGDPHALDLTTTKGKLWIHLLHIMSGGEGAVPSSAEAVNDLLLSYHLLRDDIQNFVTQINLRAFAGDREHSVWKAAAEEQCVMNVPMRELLKVDRVTAGTASVVYIVENSGVFSALLDETAGVPFICTHGQFKLAGLQLMDKLIASGHSLYYGGDSDPEGLSMALRFKQRYGEKAFLWHMTVEDYRKSKPNVALGARDTKLDAMLGTELDELAMAIRTTGKIGYQEAILPLLIQDLIQ